MFFLLIYLSTNAKSKKKKEIRQRNQGIKKLDLKNKPNTRVFE